MLWVHTGWRSRSPLVSARSTHSRSPSRKQYASEKPGRAVSAALSYDYRRQSLDSSSDYTSVEVSANGAAGAVERTASHEGGDNEGNYKSVKYDIHDYATANTRIRFKTSSKMGNTDTVWFDNIQVECSP